jgi:hypothetical protein
MVISPILRGLFGMQIDAEKRQILLQPHMPPDWTSAAMHNVRVGDASVNLDYKKTSDTIVLEASPAGKGDCWVEFSPAVSLRATVLGVELNGRPLPFKTQPNANDQHVLVRFPVYGGPNSLVIRVKNDFGLTISSELPPLGSASRGLRLISESWNSGRNQLAMQVSGRAATRYELGVWNGAQISAVDGATLTKAGKLVIQMPGQAPDSYVSQTLTIHFAH